jgi:hypothetical protein
MARSGQLRGKKKIPAFYALQEAPSKLNKNISSNIERYPERR